MPPSPARVGTLLLRRPGTRGPQIASGGTSSANPASMVAGLAAMAALELPAFDRLERLGARLRARLGELHTNGVGCPSTPVTEREVEELALDRALAALAREACQLRPGPGASIPPNRERLRARIDQSKSA